MTPILVIAVDCRALIEERVSGVSVYTDSVISELNKLSDVKLQLFYQHARRADHLHVKYPEIKWIKRSSTLFHFKWLLGNPMPDLGLSPDVFWLPDRRPFYRTSVPVVMTVHDMVPLRNPQSLSLKSRLWHRLFSTKKLLRRVDGVICPSFTVEQEIPRKMLRCVTYEGARIGRPGKAIKNLKNFSLMLAPADPRKRFKWMIRLAKEFPKDKFVWAGVKPDDDRFKKNKSKLPRNIHRFHQISDEKKNWLLRNANLLFALSEYEGFDLPVLEAVRAKTPVILSNISVHQELYKGVNFINTYDDLRTEYLRSRQNSLPIPIPRGNYTWEAAAKRTLLFLRRVVENKNR